MQGKVFKGLVEAALLSEAGTYRRSRMMDPKSNSFNIDPLAEAIDSGIQGDDFVPLWKQASSPLVLDSRYRGTRSSRRDPGAIGDSTLWPTA